MVAPFVIRTENLTKTYGSTRGVNDVSFSVESGEIVGFLGPRIDEKVRETLVAQVEAAADSRAQLFRAVAEAEERTPEVAPSLMGWVIQLAPTGARVLTALGDSPCEIDVRLALQNVMNSALA